MLSKMAFISKLVRARFWRDWRSRFNDEASIYINPESPEVNMAVNEITYAGSSDEAKAKAAWDYVYENVDYRLSAEWKLPGQTLTEGEGDCEDVTFLIASMLPNMGVDESYIVLGYLIFPDGRREEHTWNEVNGKVVDATGNPDSVGKLRYTETYRYKVKTEE